MLSYTAAAAAALVAKGGTGGRLHWNAARRMGSVEGRFGRILDVSLEAPFVEDSVTILNPFSQDLPSYNNNL